MARTEEQRLKYNAYMRVWRAKNKDKVAKYAREHWNKKVSAKEQVCTNARAKRLLLSARRNAKGKGVKCTITVNWIEKKLKIGRCEVTGLPLVFKYVGGHKGCKRARNSRGPSLDRIEHDKGYTPGNVRVVCTQFNIARNRWTDAEFEEMARAFLTRKDNG